MSASLHWKPVPKPEEDNYLASELMFKLRSRYWDQGQPLSTEVLLDGKAVPYLEGLGDCGVEDADTLVNLIAEHGEIIVYHEF